MLKVLIVDDEPTIAQGLRVLIDWPSEGFEIAGDAANGAEALAFLREHPVDLVLADIRMPAMDGLTMLEINCREEISDAAFVILSGYSDFTYAQKALRYNCKDYLLKPVERDALLSVVRRVRALAGRARRERTESKPEPSGFESALDAALGMRTDERTLATVSEQVRQGAVVHKEAVDRLLAAVRECDAGAISEKLDDLFALMEDSGLPGESARLNINYLLFQLLHMAAEQDGEVDQADILAQIRRSSDPGGSGGSREHLRRFLLEYADYLWQLRKNDTGSVLRSVEREIRLNYAQNLTLKMLGTKYFINSSYLGQIFRKQYGVPFKDYLNQVRIGAAASLLLATDKKVAAVAEEAGYRDTDYFIRKFIELKGCTPTTYRRRH